MIPSASGRLLFLFIILGLSITSCSTQDYNCDLPSIDPDAEYRLGIGDELRATVFGNEEVSRQVKVDSGGRINFPLIGAFAVAGHTADDVEAMIVDALKPDYFANPIVSVEVLTYRDFYIIGEVAAPGPYPYRGNMTVITAVAIAGGFTYRAVKDQFIITRDAKGYCGGKETAVLPGDVIEVKERFF